MALISGTRVTVSKCTKVLLFMSTEHFSNVLLVVFEI